MAKAIVRDLEEKFGWNRVTGTESSLDRIITLPDINRPGLELAGYFTNSQAKRIVVIGGKEARYINDEMDEISQRRVFEFITNEKTPCIILTQGKPCFPILQEICDRKNFPVFQAPERTSAVVVNVTNYLDELLAQSQIVHGELVRIFGAGVMITGKSGMGKSEIVLDLIKRGHQMIADDRVDVYRIHNTLFGEGDETIAGYMELRGVGIIDVKRTFGISAVGAKAEINMEIELVPFEADHDYDRVGLEEKPTVDYLGIKIVKMILPVSYGRPMATVIETAVTNYLLMQDGFDSAHEFERLVLANIEKNKVENEEEQEQIPDQANEQTQAPEAQ